MHVHHAFAVSQGQSRIAFLLSGGWWRIFCIEEQARRGSVQCRCVASIGSFLTWHSVLRFLMSELEFFEGTFVVR